MPRPVILALAAALSATPAVAGQIKHVFVIAFENHNWTQPAGETAVQQIKGNPAAPYLNSLCDPASPNSLQASCASAYHNVLATPSGDNPHIHPSEPNYIWAEAGSNLGVQSDDEPFGLFGNERTSNATLSAQLMRANISWRAYQEDIDADPRSGRLLPQSQWGVPLTGQHGTWQAINPWNGSNEYNYAPKHNPMLFFPVTSGGDRPGPENSMTPHYRPLAMLRHDLEANTVAAYNWISPDQYNDMHSPLGSGFTYHGRHFDYDQASIAEGDNFASKIVPMIMHSRAYQDGGVIILWWDETEGEGNADDFHHTLPEIVISPLAKGHAYTNMIAYSHSSDLRTMQEVFHVGPCLRDACKAADLSDLFVAGAIP